MPTEGPRLVYTYSGTGLDAVYIDSTTGNAGASILQTLDISRAASLGASGALHVLRGETAAGRNARWLRERMREEQPWPRSRARRRRFRFQGPAWVNST